MLTGYFVFAQITSAGSVENEETVRNMEAKETAGWVDQIQRFWRKACKYGHQETRQSCHYSFKQVIFRSASNSLGMMIHHLQIT